MATFVLLKMAANLISFEFPLFTTFKKFKTTNRTEKETQQQSKTAAAGVRVKRALSSTVSFKKARQIGNVYSFAYPESVYVGRYCQSVMICRCQFSSFIMG